MWEKYKIYIITALLVTVFLIGFAIYYYKKGKRTTSIAPIIKDNPNSTESNNNPAGASDTEIKQASDALYQDMNGFNTLGHEGAPYANLLAMSDTDFEKTYNQFNTDHQSEGNGTLKTWIQAEHPLYDTAFDAYRTSILERMAKLNLI